MEASGPFLADLAQPEPLGTRNHRRRFRPGEVAKGLGLGQLGRSPRRSRLQHGRGAPPAASEATQWQPLTLQPAEGGWLEEARTESAGSIEGRLITPPSTTVWVEGEYVQLRIEPDNDRKNASQNARTKCRRLAPTTAGHGLAGCRGPMAAVASTHMSTSAPVWRDPHW
jgi:hypothetical protein